MIENLTQQHEFGEEWLKRVNTGYISRQVDLGSPIIKQMFKRYFVQISRDIFFLTVFAEYLVKDKDQVKKVQEILKNSLKKATKALENKTTQLHAVVTDAGVDSSIKFTQILQAETPVITPVCGGMLDLFVHANNLHGLLLACWMAGEVLDEDKRKAEEELKRVMRVFLTTVRTMMGTTLSAMRKQQQQGKLTPEVEAELAEATTHVTADKEASEELAADEVDADAMRAAETVFSAAEQSKAVETLEEVATA